MSFEVVDSVALPDEHFGEGLTSWSGELVQLTWREGVGHIWSLDLVHRKTFDYRGEGWGLTGDGTRLIRSDGSSDLVFSDTPGGEELRLAVRDVDGPVDNLNELEWIDGLVWANVWPTSRVVVIEPSTGHVVGDMDFAEYLPATADDTQRVVLNGIAYEESSGRIVLTGKDWPVALNVSADQWCWN